MQGNYSLLDDFGLCLFWGTAFVASSGIVYASMAAFGFIAGVMCR